jgi:hypothetical protein
MLFASAYVTGDKDKKIQAIYQTKVHHSYTRPFLDSLYRQLENAYRTKGETPPLYWEDDYSFIDFGAFIRYWVDKTTFEVKKTTFNPDIEKNPTLLISVPEQLNSIFGGSLFGYHFPEESKARATVSSIGKADTKRIRGIIAANSRYISIAS